MGRPRLTDTLAMAIHATEKHAPCSESLCRGRLTLLCDRKSQTRFNARSWPADVLQIVLALFHVGPVRVFVARHAELAVAIGDRQRQIGLG